jgi:hypothetical protein
MYLGVWGGPTLVIVEHGFDILDNLQRCLLDKFPEMIRMSQEVAHDQRQTPVFKNNCHQPFHPSPGG